mgnify:FL=1
MKCNTCERELKSHDEGIVYVDKTMTCYPCFGEAVSLLSVQDFEEMDDEEYNMFNMELLIKKCPNPIKTTIFKRIVATNRFRNDTAAKNIKVIYNEDTGIVKIEKF